MPEIVISGRFAAQPATGVQRFARELVNSLDTQLLGNRSWGIAVPEGVTEFRQLRQIENCYVPGRPTHIWEQKLAARFPRSIIIGLANAAPLLARRQAVFVHDAAVFDRVVGYSRRYRLLAGAMQSAALHRSSLPLTVSDFSAGRIEAATGVRPRVMHPGTDHVLHVLPDRPNLALPRPFVLTVGAAPHKLGIPLAQAADQVDQLGMDLVIVGQAAANIFGANAELGRIPANARLVGRVPDSELRWLLENAFAYAHLSTYEGFGIPPLEAQQVGTPVVALSTEVNDEVLGDSSVTVERGSNGLASALQRLTTGERSGIVERGSQNAARFRWSDAARRFQDLVLEHC